MSTTFIWQLPVTGDARYGHAERLRRGERASSAHPYSPGITDPRGTRFNHFDHLHQVARAADLAGFDGIRIPEDPEGDEPWIVAGYLARGTRRLALLTEFEASRGSAVYAAKNAASLQRYTNGRFAWQISVGGAASQRRALADFAKEEDLLPRIEEFVTVARGVLREAPFSFKGRYFEVLEGGFRGPLANQVIPPVYLSGDSAESHRLSARVADVHVFDAAAPETIAAGVGELQRLAAEQQRALDFGLRIDIVARETTEEAVRDAHRFRQQSGAGGAADEAHLGAGSWSGLTTALTGAHATLVGSYEQVAKTLTTYAEAGISHFLLSSTPHLEEAYRLGENLLPIVRARIDPGHRRVA